MPARHVIEIQFLDKRRNTWCDGCMTHAASEHDTAIVHLSSLRVLSTQTFSVCTTCDIEAFQGEIDDD